MRRRLYLDESGDHTYSSFDDPAKRYLGLTGIILESQYYRTRFQPALEDLKQRHFPHSPDEPVILHRNALIGRHGPFWRLRHREAEEAWNKKFLVFLSQAEFTLITVVIDKQGLKGRHGGQAPHPYHIALAFMLEQYCNFLGDLLGDKGDVLAESRGGTEDRALKAVYKNIWNEGTLNHPSRFFQEILTSDDLKLKKKEHNIAGLQIADLLAHPSKQNILAEKEAVNIPPGSFTHEIIKVIGPKYRRHFKTEQIWGYGKLLL